MTLRLLIALRRIGPYHHARLRAAHQNGGLALTALETRPHSQEYAWDYEPPATYPIERIHGGADPERDPASASLDRQISMLLNHHQPQVIATVGWADRSYRRLVIAAGRRSIPLIIISDSRRVDSPRQPIKEILKRVLLRSYSAALVAGSESRAYVESLGFPPEAIFQPWDVVDNAMFADAFRMATTTEPDSPAIPSSAPGPQHFLCVSRFIPEKNLPLLLEAYGEYQTGGGSWGLRILGGGPLEAQLRQLVQALPDPARVSLAPFEQLEAVVASYHRASALVLASCKDTWGLAVNEAMAAGLPVLVSNACGCRVDLIEHDVTGWSFDDGDARALSALLHRAERQTPEQRAAMVAAAQRRLDAFSPGAFASGLQQAAARAHHHRRHSRSGALVAHLLSGVSA